MSNTRETDSQDAPIPSDLPSMHDLVIQDIQARKEFGLKKYGSLLQPFNGRDAFLDLYEELLDFMVYLRQIRFERDSLIKNLVVDAMRQEVDLFIMGHEGQIPDSKDELLNLASSCALRTVELIFARYDYLLVAPTTHPGKDTQTFPAL